MSTMPNRAAELTWNEPEPRAQGALTRSAVVRAAIAIADTDGLDAVSIRRVAAQLGARPMSLYTHIASKDDLLDLMANDVIAEVLVPEPLPEHWREALAGIARHSYAAYIAHPWVLEAFSRRPRIGPNVLRHAEQSATAVAGLELDARGARTVLGIVDDYTIGHAIRAISLGDHIPQLPDIDPAEFPQLARVPLAAQPLEDTFEIGLEVLLDGVERRFASR
jgi:AcrR family transcriptional regulator